MSEIKTMRDRDIKKVSAQQGVAKIFGQIFVYAFLLIMAFIVIFPFYWMLISSVKSIADHFSPITSLRLSP